MQEGTLTLFTLILLISRIAVAHAQYFMTEVTSHIEYLIPSDIILLLWNYNMTKKSNLISCFIAC